MDYQIQLTVDGVDRSEISDEQAEILENVVENTVRNDFGFRYDDISFNVEDEQ